MSHSDFAHLGKQSHTPDSPDAIALDRIDNPSPDTSYLVRLSVPELTCLCPVTGQPDFAHLLVDYAPGAFLVESKSFKLYIASFRNHRTFHEACTIGIGQHLQDVLQPEWIRVCGFWYPRGGIPIDVFWTQGACPDGVYIPDPGVASYRGRG